MNSYRFPIYPRLSAPTSVSAMMLDVAVALLPALAMAVYLFGLSVLWNTLAYITACFLFQWAWDKAKHQHSHDLSPLVTGLLLAFCSPSTLPLWACPVGAFLAIILVKNSYGGQGKNVLNPALTARMILATCPPLMLYFASPQPMIDAKLLDEISQATPLNQLKQEVLPALSLEEMFLGFYSGSMGEVSTMMILLGGIYLILRKVIAPTIPLSILATVGILCYSFSPRDISALTWTGYQLCSGGLMLGAFFFATDPVTSPLSQRGQVLYGMGIGALTVLLRYFGSYPEGIGFAILIMNAMVWLLDKLGMPRPFGEEPFALCRRQFQKVETYLNDLVLEIPEKYRWSNLSAKLKSTLFSRDYWKSRWQQLDALRKKFALINTEGNALGEHYLDRLPHTLKVTLSYGLILALTLTGIHLSHSLTSLARHRADEAMGISLLSQAMPQANFLTETPYQGTDSEKFYLAYNENQAVGYCIHVSVPAFVDHIELLVGVNLEGAVTGIAVMSQKETLHIGDSILKEDVLTQFLGKSGTIPSDSIDGISGATVTLEALTKGVNIALATVQEVTYLGGVQ